MPNAKEQIADKTFLTLQGAIALIVTVSLGFQGWMLMSIHEIQVQGAKVDQQIVAFGTMQERIIAFNQTQRTTVEDLQVRVRVLESISTRRASSILNTETLASTVGLGSCFNPEHLAAAIFRRRRFL